MNSILQFLTAKKGFLLFVLLELVSFVLIINSHNYAQTKVHSLQTEISGFVNKKINIINYRLSLVKINDSLQKQNAKLLTALTNKQVYKNTATLPNQYRFIPGYVVSNQYSFNHNTIIINKGHFDSIKPNMGVISSNGIVGVVQKTSKHFSKIISVLNSFSKTSVSIKNTNYTGFLHWNNQKPNIFDVVDMPVNAQIKLGDTLITSGISNIYPKGIPVGKVIDFKTLPGQKSYKITIKSFIDMTNLGPVFIIQNRYKNEFDAIKK